MIKLKECEDSHLGEEVDRNWNEVVTQQYLFDRLAREVGMHPCTQPSSSYSTQWDLCYPYHMDCKHGAFKRFKRLLQRNHFYF